MIIKTTLPLLQRRCSSFFKTNPQITPVIITAIWAGLKLSTASYKQRKIRNLRKKIEIQSLDSSLSQMNNKPCAVFIISKDPTPNWTHSNPLKTTAPSVVEPFITSHLDVFAKLDSQGILPIVKILDNPSEISTIISQIRKRDNQIQALVIAGHGDFSSIEFTKNDLGSLLVNNSFNMPEGSTIVLYACCTAKTEEETPVSMCVARYLSLTNPFCTVIAPKTTIVSNRSIVHFKIIKNNGQINAIPTPHFEITTNIIFRNCINELSATIQNDFKLRYLRPTLYSKIVLKHLSTACFPDIHVKFRMGIQIPNN